MAAPTLSITKLSENDRYVILRANIGEGGTVDASNLVLATASDYTVAITAYALSINRVWYSLDGFSVDLKFEADTPDKAITLTGNGSYDLAEIDGIKNPGTSGSTGNILLDTIGIAATGNPGSIIIEMRKVLEDESGGDLEAAGSSSTFTPEVPEVSGGLIIGGNSAAAGYISLKEDSDNGTNKVTIQAPASIVSDFLLTLPADDGDANQVLGTDGSGTLDWVTVTTAGSIGTDIQAYDADLTYLAENTNRPTTTVGANLAFKEGTDNGTDSVILQGPASLAADATVTLPSATGTILTDTDIGSTVQGYDATILIDADIGSTIQAYDSDLTDLASRWNTADADGPSSLEFLEDTDNGTNKVTVAAPASLAGDVAITLPSATGTILTNSDIGVSVQGYDNTILVDADIGSTVQAYDSDLTTLSTSFTSASADTAASLKLHEDTDNGTNYIELKSPAALAGDVTLTLPTTDGDADQVLKTDGSGNLSWVAQAAGGLTEWTEASASGGSSLKFYEDTDGGTNYIALQGPDAAAGDVTFKLPNADGSSGDVLQTNGSGVLSWLTPSSGITEETGTCNIQLSTDAGANKYPASPYTGYYSRVGETVFLKMYLVIASTVWTSLKAGGSTLRIYGLPYAMSATISMGTSTIAERTNSAFTSVVVRDINGYTTSAAIDFIAQPAGGSEAAVITSSDIKSTTVNTQLGVSIVYRTDS